MARRRFAEGEAQALSLWRAVRRSIGWTSAALAVLFVTLPNLAAARAWAGTPQERVRSTVDAVSAVLGDLQLQGADKERQRKDRVAQVIHETFDFNEMARESLGPHWTSLTPEQQAEFVPLFGSLFERSYDRLVLRFLGDSTTTYGAESTEGNRALVRTTIVRKKEDDLPVDYRLVYDGRTWAMSDVVVDGVSLAGNFRSQFDKTIRSSSYEALVQRIKTKLKQE